MVQRPHFEMRTDGLDGTAAQGVLADVFAAGTTIASLRCAGCGRVLVLAETRLFGPEPGVVLRCVACEAVLVRLWRMPGRTLLDMRGIAHLELVS